MTSMTLKQAAVEVFDHTHTFVIREGGNLSECVMCGKQPCDHNDYHKETVYISASFNKYGFSPEDEYEIYVCNVCGDKWKVMPDVDWNLPDDDLPY